MQIDTKVFEKISKEQREAAIQAIVDIMKETFRFGCFTTEYLTPIATMSYDKMLNKIRKDTGIIKKTKVVEKKDRCSCDETIPIFNGA